MCSLYLFFDNYFSKIVLIKTVVTKGIKNVELNENTRNTKGILLNKIK